MTDQAWARFEHSGSITDYLQYKEDRCMQNSTGETGTVGRKVPDGTKLKEFQDISRHHGNTQKPQKKD